MALDGFGCPPKEVKMALNGTTWPHRLKEFQMALCPHLDVQVDLQVVKQLISWLINLHQMNALKITTCRWTPCSAFRAVGAQ